MVSAHVNRPRDQADGLRRLQAAPLPALCTVLSASPRRDKTSLMQRLAHSMARKGREVLVIDARPVPEGGLVTPFKPVSVHSPMQRATLADVALGQAALEQAMQEVAPGVAQIALGDLPPPDELLAPVLRDLARERFRLLVDTELDAAGQLPLSVLSEGELVLQIEADPESIRQAYTIMRALKALCMPGMLSLLVTGTSPAHVRQVQANLFHAASRYLAMPVRAIVPSSAASHV